MTAASILSKMWEAVLQLQGLWLSVKLQSTSNGIDIYMAATGHMVTASEIKAWYVEMSDLDWWVNLLRCPQHWNGRMFWMLALHHCLTIHNDCCYCYRSTLLWISSILMTLWSSWDRRLVSTTSRSLRYWFVMAYSQGRIPSDTATYWHLKLLLLLTT